MGSELRKGPICTVLSKEGLVTIRIIKNLKCFAIEVSKMTDQLLIDFQTGNHNKDVENMELIINGMSPVYTSVW